MINIKPYDNYKDSAVDWLGDIPEHWNLRKLKFTLSINEESLSENTQKDFEFEYIDIESVREGIILERKLMTFDIAPSRARRIVSEGDVIISTVRTYLKAIVQLNKLEKPTIVSTGFAVLRPSNLMIKEFTNYYFRSKTFIEEVVANSTGVGYPAITATRLSNIKTILPPISEQQTIAAFLDYKLGKIDRFILKKKKLIKLLNEQKAAIINQAVTKGLDTNARMKPSGIDWLGDIPEHWEVRKLKSILRKKKGSLKPGPFGSDLKNTDFKVDGYKVYNQRFVIDGNFTKSFVCVDEEKYQELIAFKVNCGDILLTTRGTIGKCCIIPNEFEAGIIHPCIIRLRTDDLLVINEFVKVFIEKSEVFQTGLKLNSNATTIDVIYGNTLKEVIFLLPPKSEQIEILEFIENETATINLTISKIEKEIALVQEYRTTLIAEAVTGKIDVRGYEIPTLAIDEEIAEEFETDEITDEEYAEARTE